MSSNDILFAEVKNFRHTCNLSANFFRFLHTSLGVFALGASLIVATFTSELGELYTRIFAFMSALSLGVINSINIEEQANNFRRASRHLDVGLTRFLGGLSTDEELFQVYQEAKSMLGHWQFRFPRQ
jgi:hypothetical protein